MKYQQIIISAITLCFILFFSACKDEELLLHKTPYTGDQLRIDGYYYRFWTTYDSTSANKTSVTFLYRNGIMLSADSYDGIDLENVEEQMLPTYNDIRNSKTHWGVFVIKGQTIQYSTWSASIGGGLPAYIFLGVIDNDTTFRITKRIYSDGTKYDENEVYHFRQFSPKPDSTNSYIP